ncbi:hypothetical protein HZC31_01210 [Candidatus Woesearchaeota archaeon]|nr:hypothetical protein [Candidatus Woesearchaeota archaeon]
MEKRILLDTNVYGKLVEDTFIFPLLLDQKTCNNLVVYGTDVIRKELRAISKKATDKKGQKIRLYTLYVYDNLITKANHTLRVNNFIECLAQLYMNGYKIRGGGVGEAEIKNDFLIVACATLHNLDIVISDDKRTMLSTAALAAYKWVNQKQGFQNPNYMHYITFRDKLLKKGGI